MRLRRREPASVIAQPVPEVLSEHSDDSAQAALMSYKREAAEAAERMLAERWDDTIPVDPVRIARGLGIEVLDARLRDNVSGALMKEPDQPPSIVLNWDDHRNRKRFTAAHELGHYVRRSEQVDAYEYVDLRGPLASRGDDPDEIFANAFAAALLMPEKHVRRLAGDGLNEIQMALRFDVSREAMRHRLTYLGLT